MTLSPVDVFSSTTSSIVVLLEAYPGEVSTVHATFSLAGTMSPVFPLPKPPVDFGGLTDPITPPVIVKSSTVKGRLSPGKYRYSYAAWKGSQAQATKPSPILEILLTTENTVTLTYPKIPGADGYLVYREVI